MEPPPQTEDEVLAQFHAALTADMRPLPLWQQALCALASGGFMMLVLVSGWRAIW